MSITKRLDDRYNDYCVNSDFYTPNETLIFECRRNFRIMTYNVNGFKKYDAVIELISKSMSGVSAKARLAISTTALAQSAPFT